MQDSGFYLYVYVLIPVIFILNKLMRVDPCDPLMQTRKYDALRFCFVLNVQSSLSRWCVSFDCSSSAESESVRHLRNATFFPATIGGGR